MTFIRAFQDAILNKKKRKILFSGRPLQIKTVERTGDREISALCEFSGRALNLKELFEDIEDCDARFAELKRIESENIKKNLSTVLYQE